MHDNLGKVPKELEKEQYDNNYQKQDTDMKRKGHLRKPEENAKAPEKAKFARPKKGPTGTKLTKKERVERQKNEMTIQKRQRHKNENKRQNYEYKNTYKIG